MARRRKKDDVFDDLHELFMRVPAWLCIPFALLAFVVIPPFFQGPLAQLGSTFGTIVGMGILIVGIGAALSKSRRRQLYDEQTSIESIRALSWQKFELLIGEAFRRQGYQVTENGGGGADGGIDLILHKSNERTLVQCKQWKVYKVRVGPVRELYGVLMAERADRAIFVNSGVYTKEARDFADGKPLELIDGEQLCQMIAPGRKITSTSHVHFEVGVENPEPCPFCGAEMVLRRAKRGRNEGSQFWGCSMFSKTKCRGTRPH